MVHDVQAVITCDTVGRQTSFYNQITGLLGGKSIWKNEIVLTKGTDITTKKPTVIFDVRFMNPSDKNATFNALKTSIAADPTVSARMTIHTCSHDSRNPTPCVIEEVFIK